MGKPRREWIEPGPQHRAEKGALQAGSPQTHRPPHLEGALEV